MNAGPMLLVQLRNGMSATAGKLRGHPPGFPLGGQTERGEPELWTATGRWHEDGRAHPRDIVAAIVNGVPRQFLGLIEES